MRNEDSQYSGGEFLVGFCAGALIGAGLALLFAPRAGSDLRQQIRDTAADAGDRISKTVEAVSDGGREAYKRASQVASRVGDEMDRVADTAKSVVETAKKWRSA